MTEAAGFDRAATLEDIRRVVFTYPEASDTGDAAAVGRLLDGAGMGHFGVPEAELPVVSGDAFAEVYERSVIYYPDGLSHAKHLITNIDIEISPDGREARAHSNFVVLQARPELLLQVICTGGTTTRSGETTASGRWQCAESAWTSRVTFGSRAPTGAARSKRRAAVRTIPARSGGASAVAGAGWAETAEFDRALASEEIRRIVLSYPRRVDSGDFAAVGDLLAGVKFGGAVSDNAARVPDDQMQARTARRSRICTRRRCSATRTGSRAPSI